MPGVGWLEAGGCHLETEEEGEREQEEDDEGALQDSIVQYSIVQYSTVQYTLRQKRRESGSMRRMMRVLTPVSSIEHGPGPVGSAAIVE